MRKQPRWGVETSPSRSATPGTTASTALTSPTQAYANGTGNGSVALGDGSVAGTLGTGNGALVVGNGSNAHSYGGSQVPNPTQISDYKPSRFNTSVTVGDGSEAGAVGSTPQALHRLGQRQAEHRTTA